MLARSFSLASAPGTRRRLNQSSSGAMRQDVKLKVPPELDQVSSRSLLRVTTVDRSAVDTDRIRRWMVRTSSNGADVKRVNKSLTVVFESLSIHVKEVRLVRGSSMIGVGEIELNERFCREGACPPRKSRGKQTAPKVLRTKVWLGLPSNLRR